MPGVDILAVEEVAVGPELNWTVFWTILGVVVVGTLIYTITKVVSGQYSWPIIPAFLILFGCVGGAFGIMFANIFGKPIAYETQYKVTISPEVSMVTFMDKYEIVDIEGRIYTMREREMNED